MGSSQTNFRRARENVAVDLTYFAVLDGRKQKMAVESDKSVCNNFRMNGLAHEQSLRPIDSQLRGGQSFKVGSTYLDHPVTNRGLLEYELCFQEFQISASRNSLNN